jgi:hypothetical protein
MSYPMSLAHSYLAIVFPSAIILSIIVLVAPSWSAVMYAHCCAVGNSAVVFAPASLSLMDAPGRFFHTLI